MSNIIKLYKKIGTVRGVSSQLGISRDGVSRELAKNGITDFLKINEDTKYKIEKLYIEKSSIKSIANRFSVSQKTVIYTILATCGMRTRTSPFHKSEDFFETIDTERKAYWLGFLMADGYIHMKTTNVELTLKDKNHVEKFKNDISPLSKVKEKRSNLKGREFLNYRVTISSKKLVNDLVEKGCVQAKSNILEPPKGVPYRLERHFIRGYMDGDGSVGIYGEKPKVTYQVKFCGTEIFLNYIDKVFCKEFNLTPNKIYQKKDNKSFEYSRGGRLNFINIREYLYKDATVYLDRKREIMFSV